MSSTLAQASRNPLVVALVSFACTGILGTGLTWYLDSLSHTQDTARTKRDNAIASVSDISQLGNERRERGVLVASAIRRNAPEKEVAARKDAYDEAYVQWNAKVPGDLLRLRAELQTKWSQSPYERYVNGLTNASLLHQSDTAPLSENQAPQWTKGLFYIMDKCITDAFDDYKAASFASSDQASKTLKSCDFDDVNRQASTCFDAIFHPMFGVVHGAADSRSAADIDKLVVQDCDPANMPKSSSGG